MSELGDLFKEWHQEKRKKKESNFDSSLSLLTHEKISFVICNYATKHLLVEECIDFWPTTGRWMKRKSRSQGRGVRSLIRFIRG